MEQFQEKINAVKKWFKKSRFKETTRLYSARQVAEQQGTIKREYSVAKNSAGEFYKLLRNLFTKKEAITTLGPYSPGQAVMMKRKGIQGIYIGGWATSAKGSINEDPGADLASYPLSQVPDEAASIVRALLTADKNQLYNRSRMTEEEQEKTPLIDYRPFIIADADTGHGGDAHVRNLIRRFVEVGVSGYHIEDQRPGTKKCGHQGGKVLVSVDEQIKRLNTARFQLDVMQVPGIIVSRTDAEAATLLENNYDKRDHPFILGATNLDIPSYKICYLALLKKFYDHGIDDINGSFLYNLSDDEYNKAYAWFKKIKLSTYFEEQIEKLKNNQNSSLEKTINEVTSKFVKTWEDHAIIKTFAEAIADSMRVSMNKGKKFTISIEEILKYTKHASFQELEEKIKELGITVPWSCELARTPEGYYQIRGGIDYAITKSIAVAPFADLIWMETKTANLPYAKLFADAIHAVYPDKMLAYNLSPSFSWDTTGMTEEQMKEFPQELGKLGYVFNFITYAGHQIDGLAAEEFANSLKQNGMLALAKVQRKFRLLESPYKTPQSLVGGPRLDGALAASSGRTATTNAMGKGSTQYQHLIQTETPPQLLESWLQIWANQYDINKTLSVQLRPHQAGFELLKLSVFDESNTKVAEIVFTNIEDRMGSKILVIKDQTIVDKNFRKKRFMTLMKLFLIYRYKTASVYYMSPNEDNIKQALGMQKFGILDNVHSEIGNIIIASVNAERVEGLLESDQEKLKKIISKDSELISI